ncbi:uncharacterized protein [Clytia hemisphaerica]|uniref:uncharacterized protein n=1 Tax=Clytia hemisphaerica TaxID=252671 RepID=UPI0034D7B95B
MYWISNDDKPLKKWVRSRVLEILRFSDKKDWYYVPTDQNLADLGTRRGATFQDIDQSSNWINGHQWMKQSQSSFPIQSASEVTISNKQMVEINKEHTIVQSYHILSFKETSERYKFSQYLLNPNQHKFSTVIRIMAIVFKYIYTLLKRKKDKSRSQLTMMKHSTILINDDEIKAAETYFYRKASQEIIQFLPKLKYENITRLNDNGILVYTGRILADDQVSIVGRFTKSMKDLSSTSFCVPVIDRRSPIAYSIILDTHWNHPEVSHAGIESTLRYVLKKVYILEGRILIKSIKSSCQRCKFLANEPSTWLWVQSPDAISP